MTNRSKVIFASEKLEKVFSEIRDDRLKKHLKRAIRDIEDNAFCGIKIPNKLIPKTYISKYRCDNIWKYDLPGAWRLIYTVTHTQNIKILAMILEWFDHKNYEKRFGYRVREGLFGYGKLIGKMKKNSNLNK